MLPPIIPLHSSNVIKLVLSWQHLSRKPGPADRTWIGRWKACPSTAMGSRKNETGGSEGSARRVLPARRGSKNPRRSLGTLEGYSTCAGTRIWRAWERGEEIHIEEAASRPVVSRLASAAAGFGGAATVLTRWWRCPVAGMCQGLRIQGHR